LLAARGIAFFFDSTRHNAPVFAAFLFGLTPHEFFPFY